MTSEGLLRELDAIQVKAKEQQEVLAAAGRMPEPSPVLQQLRDYDAATGVTVGSTGVGSRTGAAGSAGSAGSGGGRRVSVPPGQAPREMVADVAPPGDLTPEEQLVRRRTDFGRVMSAQMPRGLGIILGVGRGDFALQLLQDWSTAGGIYLVDPFIHVRGYDDPANVDDREHQLVFEDLRNRLFPFEGRHQLVRDFSYSFAESFRQGGPGTPAPNFVYVDANHAEQAVAQDLELWWPLLARGGVLAGSTYMDSADGRIRVRTAVDRFASRNQVRVHLTRDDQPMSWFMFKQ